MSDIQNLDDLVARATEAARAYYRGDDELMSDAEYDQLVERIEKVVNDDPSLLTPQITELLEKVAAGTLEGDGQIAHAVPMLSLRKVRELNEVTDFVESNYVVVEPKIDGIAVAVRYINGKRSQVITRGDGQKGEDITSRVATGLTITGLPDVLPTPDSFEVRGELYMSPSDFEYSNDQRVASGEPAFANPRNATAGTVMRETARYDAKVSFAAYEVLAIPGAENTPEWIDADDYIDRTSGVSDSYGIALARDLINISRELPVSEQVRLLGEARADGRILAPTDGCVIKFASTRARQAVGSGSRHPHWAVAYKYEAETVETILLDIQRAVGRTGNISYTAVLERVELDGSMVQYATLHNADFIASNDLRIGDTVTLWKAGDIIPRITTPVLAKRPADAKPYEAPRSCPRCDSPLDTSGVIWKCHTPTCSITGLVAYAVSRDCLDVDGFSTAIAEALVESGQVARLSDLFYLNADELADLPLGVTSNGNTRVLGKKTAEKILAGLERAKQQPLNRVVCALGIRMTGRGMSRRLAAHFKTMDALLSATERDFLASGIDAVGPQRAAAFVQGFAAMREDIERMRAAGVNMGPDAPEQETAASGGSKVLAGKKVCVTGSMKGSKLSALTRNGMNELIEAHGGTAASSVSASTDILVCGGTTGSKYQKAVQLGKPILTPDQFAELLGM